MTQTAAMATRAIDEGRVLGYLHRPIVFATPHRAVAPASWLDHTPFAFWVVDALRPAVFVELGCQSGNSYASFAQAVQTLGLSTACYAVDTWQGDSQAGFFDESVFEEWSAYHDRRFAAFSRLVRSTFDEASAHFANGAIDLIHLDGYHTFEAVSHDFATWLPKLSARGVLLCHDINVREKDFGAWQLWEGLREAYPSFEFLHGHGLGVLGIGREMPEPLEWLFSLRTGDAESANAVRLFFSSLGAAVVERYRASAVEERLRTELAEAAAAREREPEDIEVLRRELAQAHEQRRRLEHDLSRMRPHLKGATKVLAKRAAEISSLQSSLATARTEARQRTDQIDRLAWTNARLRVRANAVAVRHDARAAEIVRLKRDLERVPQALRARDAIVAELETQAAAAQEHLQRLASRLETSARRSDELEAVVAWLRAQSSVRARGRRTSGAIPTAIRVKQSAHQRRQAARIIAASGLFDEAYYVERNPDVADRQRPLMHYLISGAANGRDPHPLFSAAHYAAQSPPLARGVNPLLHYLGEGWRTGRSPHLLFDPAYYLSQSPDAVSAGVDPLRHYLTHGAATGRNPHPLFDVAFYLRTNPEVARNGIEPLTHYVTRGAQEGRQPKAAGDTGAVSATEPGGAATARHAELVAIPLSPDVRRPTILIVSHVGPWQPKAGNEFRLRRLLQWYRRQGYAVIPVLAPLPGEELPATGVEAIAAEFGNAVQCHRDGRIEYLLQDAPQVLPSLNRTLTPSFAAVLGEQAATPHERRLLELERTFCHDAVASTVLHLSRALGPHVLQVEYIWMTRLLPLIDGPVLKVVDTIDVFSSIPEKVAAFGIPDIEITPAEEADRLRRADLAIAIQDDERAALARLAPEIPVLAAGVDFDVSDAGVAAGARILYVASNNARNQKGLDDFLRLAWPRIRSQVPEAELVVAGTVGDKVAPRELPGVATLGAVEDLTELYQSAAVVINPAVAGTGLKIKILDALSHCRRVVTWPSGIDGLDHALAQLCFVAHDWFEFSTHVVSVLKSASEPFPSGARAIVAEHLAPSRVYASLDDVYSRFFDGHRTSAGSLVVNHVVD